MRKRSGWNNTNEKQTSPQYFVKKKHVTEKQCNNLYPLIYHHNTTNLKSIDEFTVSSITSYPITNYNIGSIVVMHFTYSAALAISSILMLHLWPKGPLSQNWMEVCTPQLTCSREDQTHFDNIHSKLRFLRIKNWARKGKHPDRAGQNFRISDQIQRR